MQQFLTQFLLQIAKVAKTKKVSGCHIYIKAAVHTRQMSEDASACYCVRLVLLSVANKTKFTN